MSFFNTKVNKGYRKQLDNWKTQWSESRFVITDVHVEMSVASSIEQVKHIKG